MSTLQNQQSTKPSDFQPVLSKNFHFLRYLLVPTGIVDPEHETLRPPQPPANLPTCDSRAAGANSLHLIKNPVTFTLIFLLAFQAAAASCHWSCKNIKAPQRAFMG